MTDGERFTVVRHHDERGTWYRVIDGMSDNATIDAFRSQKVAHRYARKANFGWASVLRRAHKSEGKKLA